MSQATKALSIIFLIVFTVVLLRFAFQGTGNSEALSGTVITFAKEKVNRLSINNPERGKYTLQKTMSGWTVQKEGEVNSYPADEQAILSALDQIIELKPKSILTRNTSDFSRYQVDSTGTSVQLFDGENELAGLIVGRFQFVSQQEFNTFVRNAESDDVVAVNGFIGSYFSKDLDNWRDKKVWKFDQKGIMQVDFVFPGDSSFTIRKVAEEKWVSVMDTLNISSVNQSLAQLSNLNANGFIYDGATVSNPSIRIITHLDSGVKQELDLQQSPSKAEDFIVKASNFTEVFTLSKSSLNSTFLRGRKAYLKK